MPNTEEIIYDNKYGDQRISNVEAMANANIENINSTYDGMINGADTYYNNLSNNVQAWADKQTELQNEQTDFLVEQIEQQKTQAEKDYTKEQSAAYADWQKQSQKHGVNAEQMAAQGFTGSGYSESAQVSMYNTYQNRVATAKASYDNVVMNYNNSIKEAKLQNNAALAEIAFEAMQKQLELSLEGFQYKNTLLIEKTNQITNAKNTAWTQYMDVLDQINAERSFDESVRQFDTQFAEDQRQFDESLLWEKDKLASQQSHAAALQEDEQLFRAEQSELQRLYDAEQAEADRLHDAQQNLLSRLQDQKQFNDLYGTGYIENNDNNSSGADNKSETTKTVKTGGGHSIDIANVSNEHNDDWVMIPGHGKFTWSQLEKQIEAGRVKAIKNNGKVTYVWVGGNTYQDDISKKGGYITESNKTTYKDTLTNKGSYILG